MAISFKSEKQSSIGLSKTDIKRCDLHNYVTTSDGVCAHTLAATVQISA